MERKTKAKSGTQRQAFDYQRLEKLIFSKNPRKRIFAISALCFFFSPIVRRRPCLRWFETIELYSGAQGGTRTLKGIPTRF